MESLGHVKTKHKSANVAIMLDNEDFKAKMFNNGKMFKPII